MLWKDKLGLVQLLQVCDMGSDDFASVSLPDTPPSTTA